MTDRNIDTVLIALRRVIRATDIHSRNLIKTTGLTAPQLLILQTLDNKGEMSVGELAQEIHLSQATVTSILDRLSSRLLIVRQKSQTDKRKVQIQITESARAAIKDAPVPLQESFVEQFSALKDWEQSMIIASLQRIAEMMDAENLDASPVLTAGSVLSRPAEMEVKSE